MTEHARFSPSHLKLILACPGSVKYCEDNGIVGTTSEAAERGTLQHTGAEKLFLNGKLEPELRKQFTDAELDAVDTAVAAVYSLLDGDDWKTQLELTVYPFKSESLEKDCWGTADVVAWNPVTKHLIVVDYKFGYTYVLAIGNPQLKTYLLGALKEHPDAEKAEVVIIQPAHHLDPQVYVVNIPDLYKWRGEILVPKLEYAKSKNPKLTPGPWCSEAWCPANGNCPAQGEKTGELMEDFTKDNTPATIENGVTTVNVMPLDRLEEMVDKAAFIESFLKAARIQLTERIKQGEQATRFKLVPGRMSRKWTNEEEAEKFLRGQKLKDKERYTRKLLTPPQAEKVLKEKMAAVTRTKNRFEELVLKSQGNPSLVPIDDGRPALVFEDKLEDFVTEDEVDLSDLF